MLIYRDSHPELYKENKDSKGRITLTPLPDADGLKHCGNCGDVLTSNRAKAYCGKECSATCLECNTPFTFRCDRQAPTREFCRAKCSNISKLNQAKREATIKERYGVNTVFKLDSVREKALIAAQTPEAVAKREATNIERYGAASSFANPELNREYRRRQLENNGGKLAFNTAKQKATMLERYGSESPFGNPEIAAKAQATQRANNDGKLAFNTKRQRETMLERYGSAGSLSDPEVLEKQKQTMLERHGVERPSQKQEFLEKAMATIIANHGVLFGNDKISKVNKAFGQELEKRFNVEVVYEEPFSGFFVDIYVPAFNLAIDIHPTVTHNVSLPFACLRNGCSLPCSKHKPLAKTYHQKRALALNLLGVPYVQIFDWDDVESIIAILAAKLGQPQVKYSARKLDSRKISQAEANRFLNKHHIQGGSNKQSFCYGLFSEEELLAVATFGDSRFNAKETFEWIRYAVAAGVRIHGGSGRLFKKFINEARPDSIVSYIDLSHTNTSTFLDSLGFVKGEVTSPDLWWHKPRSAKAHSGASVLRLGADKIIGTSYGSRESSMMNNEDIMLAEGWLKIYRSGNMRYVWENIDSVELNERKQKS